eukprot:COSAG05_NODE_702_length_7857_cov_37.135244_11_plen_62_part_00
MSDQESEEEPGVVVKQGWVTASVRASRPAPGPSVLVCSGAHCLLAPRECLLSGVSRIAMCP